MPTSPDSFSAVFGDGRGPVRTPATTTDTPERPDPSNARTPEHRSRRLSCIFNRIRPLGDANHVLHRYLPIVLGYILKLIHFPHLW